MPSMGDRVIDWAVEHRTSNFGLAECRSPSLLHQRKPSVARDAEQHAKHSGMSHLHLHKQAANALIVRRARPTPTEALHATNQRQEHRNDDAADDDGQEHDQERLQQGRHSVDGIVHFVVIVVCDL